MVDVLDEVYIFCETSIYARFCSVISMTYFGQTFEVPFYTYGYYDQYPLKGELVNQCSCLGLQLQPPALEVKVPRDRDLC